MRNEVTTQIELIIGEDEKLKPKHQMYHGGHLQALKCILKKANQTMEQTPKTSDIIAFIGDRGTGKTTAMDAFCNILHQIEDYPNEWLERNSFRNQIEVDLKKRMRFCVLPTIDASLLEDKEDLFELILASMFQEYESKLSVNSQSCEQEWISKRQDAAREFGEVYRNHRNVKHIEKHEDIGESVISKLRAMPSSLKTQTTFDNLLKAFFSVISSEQYDKNYLVVVIDDLDLNVKHGFEMLEQIHKYLAHPQVIVLATFSYEQLLMITENHFRESLASMTKGNEQFEKERISTHCRQLARDYLDKMIPAEKRIYMPNIVKNYQETKIKTIRKIEEDKEIREVETKKYMFRKIASLLQVYYDGKGRKRHFTEVDTVRKLMSYLHFLDSLNSTNFSESKKLKGEWQVKYEEDEQAQIELKQTELMKNYSSNYELFNRDIRERMLYEKTNVEQQKFIKDILDIDVSLRAKQLVNLAEKRYEKNPPEVDIDSVRYSYCDLVECIYKWGRAVLDDKPLIHCIMAIFTSRMVREYINYMYGAKREDCEKSRSCLEAFVGENFGNQWPGDMLLTEFVDEAQPGKKLGKLCICYAENLELKLSGFEFSLCEIEELHKLFQLNTNRRYKAIARYIYSQLRAEKFVPTMECLRMLLGNYRLNGTRIKDLSYTFQFKKANSENGEVVNLICGFEADKADFDIFGFVKKSIAPLKDHREFANLVIEKFSETLIAFLLEESKGQIDEKEKKLLQNLLIEQLQTQSIFAEERDVKDTIAYPFYNFDLSYNIIKRVRRRCKDEFVGLIPQADIAKSIVRVYRFIEEELKRQGEFYNDNEVSQLFVYDRIFSDYPYISAMEELVNREGFNRDIGKILKSATSIERPEEETAE